MQTTYVKMKTSKVLKMKKFMLQEDCKTGCRLFQLK